MVGYALACPRRRAAERRAVSVARVAAKLKHAPPLIRVNATTFGVMYSGRGEEADHFHLLGPRVVQHAWGARSYFFSGSIFTLENTAVSSAVATCDETPNPT